MKLNNSLGIIVIRMQVCVLIKKLYMVFQIKLFKSFNVCCISLLYKTVIKAKFKVQYNLGFLIINLLAKRMH